MTIHFDWCGNRTTANRLLTQEERLHYSVLYVERRIIPSTEILLRKIENGNGATLAHMLSYLGAPIHIHDGLDRRFDGLKDNVGNTLRDMYAAGCTQRRMERRKQLVSRGARLSPPAKYTFRAKRQ